MTRQKTKLGAILKEIQSWNKASIAMRVTFGWRLWGVKICNFIVWALHFGFTSTTRVDWPVSGPLVLSPRQLWSHYRQTEGQGIHSDTRAPALPSSSPRLGAAVSVNDIWVLPIERGLYNLISSSWWKLSICISMDREYIVYSKTRYRFDQHIRQIFRGSKGT